MNAEEEKQGFLDHLEEARERILLSLIAVAIFAGIGLAFAPTLFHLLIGRPFGMIGVEPKVLSVTEALMARFKVALVAGVVFAMPVIVYEIWRFVKPGLYAHEVRVVRFLFCCMIFLFALGMSFCYFVVLPLGLPVLRRFADTMGLEVMWSLGSCVSFSMLSMLGFGTAFQLPLIMAALAKMGIVNHEMLANNRSIALVAVLVTSAMLTPPDVMTMGLMAGPLWILYEISIVTAKFVGTREKGEVAESADSPSG